MHGDDDTKKRIASCPDSKLRKIYTCIHKLDIVFGYYSARVIAFLHS